MSKVVKARSAVKVNVLPVTGILCAPGILVSSAVTGSADKFPEAFALAPSETVTLTGAFVGW
jgi:hypothetical protein